MFYEYKFKASLFNMKNGFRAKNAVDSRVVLFSVHVYFSHGEQYLYQLQQATHFFQLNKSAAKYN